MKKTTLFLSLLIAGQAVASTSNLQEQLPEGAFNTLSTVFPLEQLAEGDAINIENKVSLNSDFYIVSLNDSAIAISADGNHVLGGDIVDLESGINHLEQAKEASVARHMSTLSEDVYVSYPSELEETKHVMYVYSDVSCGYCKQLHSEFSDLTASGVEIRVIPFVRALGMEGAENTPNYKNTAAMMSIQDPVERRKAHDALFEGGLADGVEINNKGVSALSKGVESGAKVGLKGTPHIVLDSGKVISGYAPSGVILGELIK